MRRASCGFRDITAEASASSVSAHVATARNVIENADMKKKRQRVSQILRIAHSELYTVIFACNRVDFQYSCSLKSRARAHPRYLDSG